MESAGKMTNERASLVHNLLYTSSFLLAEGLKFLYSLSIVHYCRYLIGLFAANHGSAFPVITVAVLISALHSEGSS